MAPALRFAAGCFAVAHLAMAGILAPLHPHTNIITVMIVGTLLVAFGFGAIAFGRTDRKEAARRRFRRAWNRKHRR
jgi:hypothetical protein